ncbi:conserved hypothetical protein [Trichinella spiralis]|uniref:hypothetical protein n=1 Tax=Trichinella spiralis TaxID=6334 RepID=UPI0001EFE03E|nr:conserved hypothetical protein [Trichinella spiralis]
MPSNMMTTYRCYRLKRRHLFSKNSHHSTNNMQVQIAFDLNTVVLYSNHGLGSPCSVNGILVREIQEQQLHAAKALLTRKGKLRVWFHIHGSESSPSGICLGHDCRWQDS